MFKKLFGKKPEPTIEFFSLIPEVAAVAPIVYSHNFRPEFMQRAVLDLAIRKRQEDYGSYKLHSTAKCPGVYNYYTHGWVMTTYQDIVITTNGDGESFTWETPMAASNFTNEELVGEYVSNHPPGQYADLMGDMKGTLRNVLKLQTPWRCVVPEGYYLLEEPMPYTTDKRFTTISGFYNNEYGVSSLNVQLLWHVMEGRTVIKAGTPIAHYMLVPKDLPKLVSRAATEKDITRERISRMETQRKYISDRSESKCVFAKMFGDNNGNEK